MCTVAPVVVARYKIANMVTKTFFTAYLQRYNLKTLTVYTFLDMVHTPKIMAVIFYLIAIAATPEFPLVVSA